MAEITSRQHRIVGAFKAAARRDGELALLDGWHLLGEAAAAGIEIATVAVSDAPSPAAAAELLPRLARQCEVFAVSAPVMQALSPVRTPSGVVALARPRPCTLQDVLTPAPALIVAAVDLQDPGNAGAIIRSAEAGGATGVLLLGQSADPWGWKALRAAMGSTFRVPVVRAVDSARVLRELRDARVLLLACVPRDGTPSSEVDMRGNVAIILGSEGGGLDDQTSACAHERLSIPMSGSVESLNVAVAAALVVYEARRQRQ